MVANHAIPHADPGWQDVLAQYNVQWILVPVDEPIARLLAYDNDWQNIYTDQTAVIFRKR
jgi:hypothetical protein